MSKPNKDGTDIMMALLMGLSGPRASKAWNESQQIKAESFLTMAEHWINQTAEENARLKAEVERLTAFTTRTIIPNEELQAQVERLTKAGDELHAFLINYIVEGRISSAYLNKLDDDWNAAKEGKQP
jgi:leucyl-tRNA synthetase